MLWILVITKPEFPHDFAQVQNGQHCLHLSTDFLPMKNMQFFGAQSGGAGITLSKRTEELNS